MLSRARVALLILAALLSSRLSRAETGFTYSVIRDFSVGTSATDEQLCSYAFNDLGQVAYTTIRNDSAVTVSLYFWNGVASQLVYSSKSIQTPGEPAYIFCSSVRGGVGLNNSGLMSAYGTATDPRAGRLGEGFLFFTAASGLISTQFPGPIGSIYESRGLLNSLGEVAWRANGGEGGTVDINGPGANTFGADATSTFGFGGPVDSNDGAVEQFAERPEANGTELVLLRLNPTTGTTNSSIVGPASQLLPNAWSTPGLNAKGFTALATQSATTAFPNREFRVVLIDPDLTHSNTLADAGDTTTQPTALPGISLNDKNQVVFAVHDLSEGVDSLWLTRAPETSPLPIWSEKNALTIGSRTIANARIGSDAAGPEFAINAASDVIFTVESDREYLVVAHPMPGFAPGNPILPPGDPLPGGGFEFTVNCLQYGLPAAHPHPLWCDPVGGSVPGESGVGVYFDPPIASGYQYTADPGAPNFGSIFIPAPLPGGQSQFTVTYNGVSDTVMAGHVFQFTQRFPQGVAAFAISGINAAEALDATDPQAFVAALTFLVVDNPIASFKMVPTVTGAIPTVAPIVTGKQGAAGWYTSDVALSFIITDPASRVTSESGCGPSTITADTAGTPFTCTLEGAGGPWTSTVTIKRDTASPTIAFTTPTSGASYPVGATVPVSFACQDAVSGVAGCSGSVANGALLDTGTGGSKTLSVTAIDNAGNVMTQSVNYVVADTAADTTAPVVTPQIGGTLGDNGWYRSAVSLTWNVSDSQSAISTTHGCSPSRVTSDTSGTTFTCAATSKGGTTSKSVTIKLDDDAPLGLIVFPLDGLTFNRNDRLPALYACVDLRSGIAQCNGTVPVGSRIDTATPGTKTFTLSARDKAGNVYTSTVRYHVR